MNIISKLRRGAFLGLALLLCAGAASAQMYKWVDANGKTHFTDMPPPATAKTAKVKGDTGSASAPDELPYALTRAMRSNPVTLYTTPSCAGCDSGRSYLKSRGVPFSEKTVTTAADEEKYREAGGEGRFPFVLIGRSKLTGFQISAWDSTLAAATYPAKSVLPSSYRNPEAVAAAPQPVLSAEQEREAMRVAAAEEEEQRRKKAAEKAPLAPPGFRF